MLKSGFYNAMKVGGEYDRKYNADDYKNVFAAFLKDGVRRSGLDDFKVTASGLALTAKMGYAICGGRWVNLDADYSIGSIIPPVGDYSRIDAVVIRVDNTESTRSASLLIRTGTPASSPQPPAKDTTTGVSELVIAHVLVEPSATSVTVTDTRPNANLCGWITTPVGYDDFFTSLDKEFETWFENTKDTLSSVTLFRQYSWRTVLTGTTSSVTFNIPQFDPTGTDIIHVYVNGLLELEGIDYTLSGSTITFGTGGGGIGTKIAGTEIVVLCYKSIDGTGLGSVADAVDELQNQVSALTQIDNYQYVCNGVNDNVLISELAQTFINGGTDNRTMKISVYGTIGMSAAAGGSGTSSNYYKWFNLGSTASTNRRLIVDFTNASVISPTIATGTYNTIFSGTDCNIIGADVVASQVGTGTLIRVFDGRGAISAENCRFWITSNLAGYVAQTGTFIRCRCSLSCAAGNAFCFNPVSTGLVRIDGGEYYAYTALSSGQSAVGYCAADSGVLIMYGVNCPTVSRSGYYQTHAVLKTSGNVSITDTITTLTVAAPDSNIRGTLVANKPGMM